MKPTRTYLSPEAHDRVQKYAYINRLILQQAYEDLIFGLLDENGCVKERILLTDSQQKVVKDISIEMDQSIENTVRDLINYALLIYGTHITLRELFLHAAPAMMDELISNRPDIAKEILKGLRSTVGKRGP